MKKLAICILGGMSAFSAMAVQNTDQNISVEKDCVNTVLDDPFFKNTKITVSAKNYWKYLKEESANPKEVHSAWGQGFAFDYQSGYFNDFIGFDASFYSAVKLGASDYFDTRAVLYNNGTGNKKSNADGYSKFGQRFVKMKTSLHDVNFNVNGGWQTLKNFGVVSNSTRLSPTTYQGWNGTINYHNITLRGAYVTHSIDRNSPDKKQFQTQDKKHNIDHIITSDILYKDKMINAQYAYGESKDYLRRHIFLGSLKPTNKLTIGTQLYFTEALDLYKNMAARSRYFDSHANHYALDIKWQEKDWSAKLGLGYTDAKKGDDELGFYHRHMTRNSRGTFASMAFAGEDYLRHGEKVIALMLDYKLTQDVTVGFAGNYGFFDYEGTTVKTGEASLFSRWAPSHERLKGLTVWGMFGPGWSYKMKSPSNKTPVLKDGAYQTANSLSAEFIVEYRFNLL